MVVVEQCLSNSALYINSHVCKGSSYYSTMNTAQQGSSSQHVDSIPMPSDIPHVDEVGATSAPLKSAAFFIGAYCKEFNGSFCAFLREKRVISLILFFLTKIK